jgi:protein ImuA
MAGPEETIRLLAGRIRALETSLRPSDAAAIPLGPGGLADLFPAGQLPSGSLVELLPCVPGAGAWSLALHLAQHACGERKTLLIADPERCFHPPAARKFGFDPDRIILVRPPIPRDAMLALAQALRCSAIGAALGAFERLADRDGRRLQLAAEAGGTIGVLVRSLRALKTPSFAAVRLRIDPLPSPRGRRRLRVEVLRCRGGRGRGQGQNGKTTGVEIDDATGHVRAFSLLELAAEQATAPRSTG